MSRLGVLAALLATSALPVLGPLRGPLDVNARRATAGRALPPPPPSPVAPPIRDLAGVSYYLGSSHAIVDPVRKQENQQAFAPLRAYVGRVIDLANGWVASRPPQPAYATRAVEALARWARDGSLLGTTNQQGVYERAWTLSGLALAYLQIRDVPSVDPAARAAVDAWLVQVAEAVRLANDHPGRMSSQNNHAYWAGLGVAATGAATQSRPLFAWGIERARIGLGQIHPDGFLPLELGRRQLAFHYHQFALAPLVMLAELGRANGIDLYGENNGALRKLADRVIDGWRDPAPFAAAAGVTQEMKMPPRGADLAWAEPYYARFHDRRLVPLLAAARPLRDDRLGGDLTGAFGVPLP
ncbi:MAG TPA: alginate lyase family protein [Polyangia bacterium]|nr:alginate lyase family protein [Polyangia bacterium]